METEIITGIGLFVEDHVAAIDLLFHKGEQMHEKLFNISGFLMNGKKLICEHCYANKWPKMEDPLGKVRTDYLC